MTYIARHVVNFKKYQLTIRLINIFYELICGKFKKELCIVNELSDTTSNLLMLRNRPKCSILRP